jgi:hypothetical protein
MGRRSAEGAGRRVGDDQALRQEEGYRGGQPLARGGAVVEGMQRRLR